MDEGDAGPRQALEILANREALVSYTTELVANTLANALDQRGVAGLALSGGSTPGPVYRRLSAANLDWSSVTVGLADERWVDPDSDASNEHLVRVCLMRDMAENVRFLPMKTPHASAAEAVPDVDRAYAALADRLDLLVLGMGSDGHCLSWFPQAQGLDAALDPAGGRRVAAIRATPSAATGDHLERMTLTFPMVAQARSAILLITGETKKNVYETGPSSLPVRSLQRALGAKLTVLWAP